MGQATVISAKVGYETESARRLRYEAELESSMPGLPVSIRSKYSIDVLVHEGAHGQVWRLTDLQSGRHYALKTYKKELKSYKRLNFKANSLQLREIKSCSIKHAAIASCRKHYESNNLFCIAMEWLDGGSVRYYLEKRRHLSEIAAARILSQMLSAIAHLHRNGIVHRDLRLEQFLFAAGRKLIKLGDLMHCARSPLGGIVTDRTKPMVLLFAAPETIEQGEFSLMSDMWSVGCMLYEMFYGHPPFSGCGKSLLKRIVDEEPVLRPMFEDVSDPAVELLGRLLQKDPTRRAKCQEAASDFWFRFAEQTHGDYMTEKMRRRLSIDGKMQAELEAKRVQELEIAETNRREFASLKEDSSSDDVVQDDESHHFEESRVGEEEGGESEKWNESDSSQSSWRSSPQNNNSNETSSSSWSSSDDEPNEAITSSSSTLEVIARDRSEPTESFNGWGSSSASVTVATSTSLSTAPWEYGDTGSAADGAASTSESSSSAITQTVQNSSSQSIAPLCTRQHSVLEPVPETCI